MLARHYAQALLELTVGKSMPECRRILKNFFALLVAKGHQALSRSIAKEFDNAYRIERERETVRIFSSHDLSAKELSRLKRKHGELFKGISHIETAPQKNLIGGEVIKTHSKRLDLSHRLALLSLYRNLTSKTI